MPLLPPNLDYSDRDSASLRLRLQNLVRSVFPTWTDFNIASFGNLLLEMYAFVGDILNFYQDNQANEGFVQFAKLRKSLIYLAKWHGYVPLGAAAATATLTFSIAAPRAYNVTIAADKVCSTSAVTGAVDFRVLADAVIVAGQTSVTGIGKASKVFIENFISRGLANESYILSQVPFLDNSAALTQSFVSWVKVESLLDSNSTARNFVVDVDEREQATVSVGNGVQGALLSSGLFTIHYETGGGVVGNVEAGAINRISGPFVDSNGDPVTVSVTNVTPAAGGADRQTLEQLRQEIPLSLRTLHRAVGPEDYEFGARQVPGVERALCLTSDLETGISENTALIFVVPSGIPGSLPSALLKEQVLAQFVQVAGYPKPPFIRMLTVSVRVLDAVFLTVNVSTTVYLKAGAVAATVRSDIASALTKFFAFKNEDGSTNERVNFGFKIQDEDGVPVGSIAWSDIFDVIRDVSGVRKVDAGGDGLKLNAFNDDLTIGNRQFPILGTVTIINGATGLSL